MLAAEDWRLDRVLWPRDLGPAPGWGGAFRKGVPGLEGAWMGRGLSGWGLHLLKVSRLPGLTKQSCQLFPPQPCPGLRSYHFCPFCFCCSHSRFPEQPLRPFRKHPPKAQPPARSTMCASWGHAHCPLHHLSESACIMSPCVELVATSSSGICSQPG